MYLPIVEPNSSSNCVSLNGKYASLPASPAIAVPPATGTPLPGAFKIVPFANRGNLNVSNVGILTPGTKFTTPIIAFTVFIGLFKIFSIAEKRKSFDKTIKLLNFIILKLKDRDDKIDKFLNIFTKIVFAEYKNNTIANVDKYKELYDLALSTLTDTDKETSQYKFLSLYQLLFDNEYLLYKDDSFVFTSAEKKISNVFSSLPDITTEEDESFQNFINDINSKKQIEFSDMLSTAIKRRLCVMMYLNMSSFCHMKMRVYIKQFYRNIMLNHIGKLNEEMKKKMKDAIKNVEHGKGNIIKAIDDRIKETPLESYYKVEDAREEKYVVANMNKWEAKQNGIEATKQYFG